MSDEPVVISEVKQWVTLRSGSMQAYLGKGDSEKFAGYLKSSVGRPHTCALASIPEADPDLVEYYRRELTCAGFYVEQFEVPAGECTISNVEGVWRNLLEKGVTADDAVFAIGDLGMLSTMTFACANWCGGTSLALAPTTLTAVIAAGTTPLPVDFEGGHRMVEQEGRCRFLFCDLDAVDLDPASDDVLTARALMAATAMCDNDKAFGRLWDRAQSIADGDLADLVAQLGDTLKSRGKVVSSSSAATRQSIEYGQDFRWAMASLLGETVPTHALLAEGMRFAGRLAVGKEELSVDDMLTQDELLEVLGLGETFEASVDPDEFVAALKRERFERSRKFMLLSPRALGRVRLGNVEEDLLAEHAGAWCAAHAPEA